MSTGTGIFLAILAIVALYLVGGWLTLVSGSLNVQKATGDVWNNIDIGSQKIGLLESQVLGAYQQQKDVVNAVVSGRRDLDAARQSGDIVAATSAAERLAINIRALAEANPVTNLTPIQRSLMDESSEALNQVRYMRGKLIEAQRSYAFARAFFFPLAGAFPDYGILGSDESPTRQLPTSIFRPNVTPQPTR